MKTVTIIVAIINDDLEQIRNCLTSIDRGRFEVIIVCPANYRASINSIVSELVDFKIISTEQSSIRALWRQGENSSSTLWMAFILSSDILTVRLQKNIDQGCAKFTPRRNYKYDLQRIFIFLKRRLKHCSFWTGEPIPHIKFQHLVRGEQNNKDQPLEKIWPAPMGDLIHYGPETLSKAISTSIFFIEEWAENVYHKFPNLDKKTIFKKAAIESLTNFFSGIFFKKWIRDGYEGFVFALINLFITCFGYLRYHEKYIRSGRQLSSQINSIQNILLLNVNGIGDSVSSTPVIRNLKERLPRAKIDILVHTLAKEILENNPYVNRIFTLPVQPPKKEIKKIAKVLKFFKYDLIVNFRSRNSTEKLVGTLSSRWKVNINHFYRERFTDVMVGFKKNSSSFIHSEFEFLKEIGFEPKKYEWEIFLKNEEIEGARHFLNGKGFNAKEKLIVFHPFASDPIREWGMDRFIDLAKRLNEVCKCNILVVGAKSEIDKIETRIFSQVPRCVLYSGSVRKTLSIINESNLLIGGDSVFSHISTALNIPTLVIQGPLWKPYLGVHWDKDLLENKKDTFLFCKEDLSCRDLLNTGCGSCSDQVCFNFSVDEVLDQALKMLN
tara:strand:- start:945 stop:2771 length:1827 start_codon:yes stop_codon:yes gene_type:complete